MSVWLNPTAAARMANRLVEASDRKYWQPDDATSNALLQAAEGLEDRIEMGGRSMQAAA